MFLQRDIAFNSYFAYDYTIRFQIGQSTHLKCFPYFNWSLIITCLEEFVFVQN